MNDQITAPTAPPIPLPNRTRAEAFAAARATARAIIAARSINQRKAS